MVVRVSNQVTDPLRKLIRGTRWEEPLQRTRRALRSARIRQNHRDDEQLRTLLRLAVRRDANCVDVGANLGHILAAMVDAAPDGHHVAFEPIPDLRADLQARFPAVEVRGEALSDTAGTAEFTAVTARQARSGLSSTLDLEEEEPSTTFTVQRVRLDDVLTVTPAFIKIDVEGGELEALRGAEATIARHGPLVAFEHQFGKAFDEQRSRAVHDLLTAYDYRVFDMGGVLLSTDAFLQAVAERRRWNFVAHS